jgi:hypothetical protein
LDCETLGDGLGRLAPGEGEGREAEAEPVDGRAPAVPAEGRALAPPLEGPAPPEPQPRACLLAADVEGLPLLLNRLWSGCHFCWALVVLVRFALEEPEVLTLALRLTLTLLFTLTFRFTLTFTSPW